MALVKAGKWKKVMCIQACVLESLTIVSKNAITSQLKKLLFQKLKFHLLLLYYS